MAPSVMPEPRPTAHVSVDGRLSAADRERLRRIPSVRNAFTVVFLYAQNIAILAVAARLSHPLAWVAAFVLMGRMHA